jgi:hypothetical protein
MMEKTATATAKRYKATTPNPQYKGVAYGVRFEDGQAYFDELTVKPILGLSADEIAAKMQNDLGYTVEVIGAK